MKNDRLADPRLAAILDRSGDPATVAWAHNGTGDVASLADPELAIAAAEALGNAAALNGVTAPKPLRKAAAAALHKLRSRGVKVEAPVATRSFSLGKEEITIPPRAFLSLPDDDGDMQLLLTCTDDEGSCVFATIIGGPNGVREARHAHVNRGELRDVIRQTEAMKVHAEIPFVAGLHYADRLHAAKHEHGWEHFLEHVAPATLTSSRLLDPLLRLPPARDDEPEPHPWMPHASLLSSKALAAGVAGISEIVTSELYADEADRRTAMDAVMSTAADTALDAESRGRVLAYLEWVIAACTHYGWPRHVAQMVDIQEQLRSGSTGSAIPAVRASAQLHLARTVVEMADRAGRGEYPGEGALT